MMNDFFRITSSEHSADSGHWFNVELNPDHEIYKGHFPGMPVTPGVCTLSIVKHCALQVHTEPLRFDTIRDCKFLEAILPTENSPLRININLDSDLKLNCEITQTGKVMMKLRATMTPAKL